MHQLRLADGVLQEVVQYKAVEEGLSRGWGVGSAFQHEVCGQHAQHRVGWFEKSTRSAVKDGGEEAGGSQEGPEHGADGLSQCGALGAIF